MQLRNPALDGLRGIAVLAVVVFHAGGTWLPGGWLGVDVFFVLSGFLITTLIVREWTRERRCDLAQFWSRRVRRLLPATLVVLAGLAILAAIDDRALRYRTLRSDALASLASVVNWRFASEGEAYFDRFAAPSLLRHLWSLAVEAQFYVLWPLLLVLLLLLPGRFTALTVTAMLAGLSAVAMALLASDTARAYFGTDTHAHGLLLGAAAALLCARVPPRGRAVAVAGGLGALVVALGFLVLDGADRIALRGGIFAVALATVAVVVAVSAADANGLLARALSSPPLRVAGVLSFGIYLWHWPLLHVLDRQPVVLPLVLTAVAAVASFALVERPVLQGRPRPNAARVLGAGAITLTVVLLVALAVPVERPQAQAEAVSAERSVERAPATPVLPAVRRVVVVGDSVAFSALPGLVAHEQPAQLEFLSAAQQGCPLEYRATEHRGGDQDGPLELPAECDWRLHWPGVIERTRPDAVFAWWGLWDALDRRVDGTWYRAGSAEWVAATDGLLEDALQILTAHGARVVIGTMPYIWWLEGSHMDAFNEVVRTVAARHPGVVTVVEMETEIQQPGVVRWDGVHLTAPGAEVLGRRVVPMVAGATPAKTSPAGSARGRVAGGR